MKLKYPNKSNKGAAGRKPYPPGKKKKQLQIYIEESIIEANGGSEKAKEKAIGYLTSEADKQKDHEERDQRN